MKNQHLYPLYATDCNIMGVNKLLEGLDCETNDEEDDWNEAPGEGTRSSVEVLLENNALIQVNN